MSQSLLVYLSGGIGRQHFTHPGTGEVFQNKKKVQAFLWAIYPRIEFTQGARKDLDYVVYPNEAKNASPSSLKYRTPSLSLNEFVRVLKSKAKSYHTLPSDSVSSAGSPANDPVQDIIHSIERLKIQCAQQESELMTKKTEINRLESLLKSNEEPPQKPKSVSFQRPMTRSIMKRYD
jgi:hypothetical protein